MSAVPENLIEEMRRLYRGLEMSAAIMRDPARTGRWAGAEKTAAAFSRYAATAQSIHALLVASATGTTAHPTERGAVEDAALLIQVARCHLQWFREGGENGHRLDQVEKALAAYEALTPPVTVAATNQAEPRTNAEIVEQANDLARQFYARRGYEVLGGYRFQDATHPHEVEAWDMAVLAMEVLTDTDAQEAANEED